MASPGSEIESSNALKLAKLFENISSKFTPAESEDVVESLKRNYGGKFNLLHNQDLLPCLQLLEKHGHVSDNKLTLIEEFVAPKSNKEELIKKTIDSFKDVRQTRVKPRKELQGRQDEIKEITRELETGKSSVVNLFGSAGVGKTTLANEVCSKWKGKYFVFDLREAKDMNAIYMNMMDSLGLAVRIGFVNQDSVVARIHEEIQSLKSENQPVLFLLDNVEQFIMGRGKEGKNLKTAFLEFLESLSNFEGKEKKTSLKLLLTSRTELQDAKTVHNFEVKSLESTFSEKILVSKVMASVNTDQKNQLIGISKGIPLLLKGLAAILRQERRSADDLIAGVQKGEKSEEDAKEKPLNFEEEGIDTCQLSTITEMFATLPTENLKVSAVSISLFCGPFSVSTAAKVLGISVSETLAQLEGLVTSAIIFVVDEEAKERKYDIHPLLRKYADSIKNDAIFQRAYLEAKGRFHQHFMSKMEKIAKLIEPDYVRAFRLFESDRPNYEFTVEISLQPEFFSVPGEFHENALIASLFTAMLTEEKLIKLFHSWAEMCQDDGQSGSLCRAQLKCREARQVLDKEGTKKAFEVLKEASQSLENVQPEDSSSESYRLSKGLLLYSEGEIYYRNGDYKTSLKSLESSLKFTEVKDHTDLARCYNAIGNCHFKLGRPDKALEFYNKAYNMQKKLAGSENHFDMPMYKNQIGTVFESLGDYDEAIKYYNKALSLLNDLKLSGFQDEAHFCRNLANALMFQKKYRDAVDPADRAFNIRMKILGNDPLTVRSLFQRAVIQVKFGAYKKALKLFLEAWEMEKSLGAGNHSEVWRKIITGVEDMHDEPKIKQLVPSFLSKKGNFKKDALTFCQRFWKEQKNSEQFGFTEYNKDIIDAIIYLASNKKDKHETEKEALWFYDGMQNATEEEFQEEFDKETDNSRLNEMLKKRDEFLNKLVKLCHKVADHEKLSKHNHIKLALYKKALVRPDFVGEKEYACDKATLKGKVEQLYRDMGQKEKIPGFRENLLCAWQKQWEEGKDGEKTKENCVARERMINGILQLCKELKKNEMFRRYGREALDFYENTWEVKQAKLRPPEMKKFLHDIKKLASSIGDKERKKYYREVYQAVKGGKHPPGTLCSRATEIVQIPLAKDVSSKSEEEDYSVEEEEEIEVGSEDETDMTLPINDNKKTLIRRGEVSCEGDIWSIKEAAALITFHRGTVKQPLLFTCSLWSPRSLSPPLGSNELLVSNVIELSHDGPPDLEFIGVGDKGSITVALLHSTSNLKGYEVVIKQLVDPENNEWRELETKNIWHTPAKPSAPNWLFPFAEATCTITRHSSFAAIWRLKSFIFTKPKSVTPEFTCVVPDYPDVSITIPRNSLPTIEDFCMNLKVQEAPSIGPNREGMLVGPILHVSCSHNVELLEPAKISIPLTLFEGKKELSAQSSGQWRILHNSSEKSQEWTEITDQLKMPPVVIDGILTFKVKHFSWYWPWWLEKSLGVLNNLASDVYSRLMGQHAGFLACLCDVRPAEYVLTLSCFPIHRKPDNISSTYIVNFQGEGTSEEPLCPKERALVVLSPAFSIKEEGNPEDLFLKFLGDEPFVKSWPVRVQHVHESDKLKVEFFRWAKCLEEQKKQEGKEKKPLCRLFIAPTSSAQDDPGVGMPSTSQVMPEHQDPPSPTTTLKVTLLGDEWGSSAGGLSTLNRELAIHLAKRRKVEVTFLVPKGACTDEQEKTARSYNISVVEAEKRPGFESRDWLNLPPRKHTVDVVIGHGIKLGRQAQFFVDPRLCNSKWVQVVHTAPEQLAMFKSDSDAISKGERKHETEVELCKLADLVVAIGPKLSEVYSPCLRSEKDLDTFELTPGLFQEFKDLKQDPNESSEFKVLLCGRGDPEDFKLKGYDIAAKAFAEQELKGGPYGLLSVGAPDGKQDEVVRKLLNCGIAEEQLTVRKFVESREKMADLFCEVDLTIMPSRTEGFGLIALEALSAGLPILVSGNSGFAEALQNLQCDTSLFIVDSKEPKDWAKAIKAVRARHGEHLQEIWSLRESYGKRYSWDKQCEALVQKMWNMVHGTQAQH